MLGIVVASSARVRVVGQLVFKVKYCHAVFAEVSGVKERCESLFREILERNQVEVEAVGFDKNHVHFLINVALHHLPQLVKKLKGETGRKLLQEFPAMKNRFFWGSGFWNPSYYFDTGGNFERIKNYVQNQALSKGERQNTQQPEPQLLLTDF